MVSSIVIYCCAQLKGSKHCRAIGQISRVLANSPGRPGFNSRSSHTKDSKNGSDAALLSTQHFTVRIKGKVEQSWKWSCALLYTLV